MASTTTIKNKIPISIFKLASIILCSSILFISCKQDKTVTESPSTELDANKEYHVILMAGQSNMVGLGDPDEIKNSNMPNNCIYYNFGMDTNKSIYTHTFGPEIGLSEVLNREFPDSNFILIKYAVGGSSIEDWLSNIESKNTLKYEFGDLYKVFLNKVDSITEKYNTKNTALLWMQGETDARYEENAANYEANFKAFAKRIRNDMRSPELPIIFGKVNPDTPRHLAIKQIQLAQENINQSIENTIFINTDALEKLDDKVHYSTKGLWELGHLYGNSIVPIIKKVN